MARVIRFVGRNEDFLWALKANRRHALFGGTVVGDELNRRRMIKRLWLGEKRSRYGGDIA